MSLFGGLMGDLDDDPYFGGHMRRMNSMMNTMMSDFFGPPFGGMLGHRGNEMAPYDPGHHGREIARRGHDDFGMSLMPMGFGFPNMRSMFEGMANNGNCHSYSSSTVMTMTSGPDGRPQVYQASTSTRQAPGGIRETKKTVADSRTGVKKMSIGHHIGDRGHVMGREQNIYSGEQEEHQEFINLEEDEAEVFNNEWERKTRNVAAISYGGRHHHHPSQGNARRHRESPQLALPPATSSSLTRHIYRPRRSHYPQLLPPTSSYSSSSTEKVEVGKKRRQLEDESDSEDEPQPKKKGSPSKQPIILEVTDSD